MKSVFVAFLVIFAILQPVVIFAQNSCSTPINAPGLCIPFQQCKFVTDQHKKYGSNLPPPLRRFLQKSVCEGDGPGYYLCCDISQVDMPTTTSTTTTTRTTTYRSVILPPTQYDEIDQRGFDILKAVTKCGAGSSDRISGGEDTRLGEFPWMALLHYDSTQPFQCGGSLITDRFVLTAAHCLVGIRDNLIGVRLGEYNTETEPDCQTRGRQEVCNPPAEDFGIDAIRPHPLYKEQRILYDIALIKLDRKVNFGKHIQPICLPITPQSTQQTEKRYIIAGWGLTENDTTSPKLLKSVVNQKELSFCRSTYTRVAISDNEICAGGDGKNDTCKGDSGGPLFFLSPFKTIPRWVQYGVVSAGVASCGGNKAYPGIYSSVIKMLPWITQNLN